MSGKICLSFPCASRCFGALAATGTDKTNYNAITARDCRQFTSDPGTHANRGYNAQGSEVNQVQNRIRGGNARYIFAFAIDDARRFANLYGANARMAVTEMPPACS
jgi:hypothetical protein